MIEPETALVVIHRPKLRGFEHVAARVWQRIQLLSRESHRVLHVRRDLIPREWLACELIDQRSGLAGGWIHKSGEISCPLGGGGNDGGLCLALGIALAFVVEEEEILVLTDGTAQSAAVLVAVQRLGLRGEEIARVHGVVSEEIINIAMKIVTSRFRHHRRCRAAGLAIFGWCVERQNAEFIHGVHRHAQSVSAIYIVHVAGTVQQIVVRLRPLTIHRVSLAGTRDAARFGETGGHGSHTRLQQAKLRQIAPVQWKIHRLFFIHHIAKRGTLIHSHGFTGDIHLTVLAGDLQLHGPRQHLADVDANRRG